VTREGWAPAPGEDPPGKGSSRWRFFGLAVFVLLLGALFALSPIAAVISAAALILIPLSLIDLAFLIAAWFALNIIGEPWGLSYLSVSTGLVSLFPSDFLLLLLLAVFLLRVLRREVRLGFPQDRAGRVLAVFLLYGLFSFVRSIPLHGRAALPTFRQEFFYALFFYMTLVFMKRRSARRRFLIAFLAAAVGIGLIGIWNMATGHFVGGMTGSHTYRYLSGLQAMILIFALGLIWATVGVRSRSLWGWILVGLCVIGIMISQARSVWLGGVIAVTVVAMSVYGWKRPLLLVGLPLLILVGLIVRAAGTLSGIPIIGSTITRMASLAQAPADVTTLWRLVTWAEAIRAWTASPVLGLGLGRQMARFDPVIAKWDTTSQMHNSYLDLMCNSGLIGLLLLVLFQGIVLHQALVGARRATTREGRRILLVLAGCQVCLAAVAFTNVVTESMVATTYSWILCGIIMLEVQEARVSTAAAETGHPPTATDTAPTTPSRRPQTPTA
jgi:O-antigen ligase